MKRLFFAFFALAAISVFGFGGPAYGQGLMNGDDGDKCFNLDGYQTTVPAGYVRNGAGDCVTQEVCEEGKVCGWINVENPTSFEGISPSASAQGFYNNDVTKDKLCQLRGYEYNPGDAWAVRQKNWAKCNAEYHIDWRGYWDIHGCGGSSYVSEVYCAKAAANVPSVSISASPNSVPMLGKTTLIWSSSNATACVASGNWSGAKAVSGEEETSMFLGERTFNIACTGPGGSASDSVTVGMYIVPSAPTIAWSECPAGEIGSGSRYRVEAEGRDSDGDLSRVVVTRDGGIFSDVDGGSGDGNWAGNDTSDIGPKTIAYKAWSEDSGGRKSSVISCDVKIGPRPAAPAMPNIIFTKFPPSPVGSNQSYEIEATAYDLNGDLKSIEVTKNGVDFASAGPGDGYQSAAGLSTSDSGPKTVGYEAIARDDSGMSSTLRKTLEISSSPVVNEPLSASVSAPSCAPPGRSFTVRGNASGSGIISNILEKDTNLDGDYGAISSRNDAGETRAEVDVPSNETSAAYAFRVAVNNGAKYSDVVRVSINRSCTTMCTVFSICPPPPVSVTPSVELSASNTCVAPNSSLVLTSEVSGSPITSNVIQKDTPAEGSQYGDGSFGTIADYGANGGTNRLNVTVGREGYYDYKALVNGTIASDVRVRASQTCVVVPPTPPSNPPIPSGSCTVSWSVPYNPNQSCYSWVGSGPGGLMAPSEYNGTRQVSPGTVIQVMCGTWPPTNYVFNPSCPTNNPGGPGPGGGGSVNPSQTPDFSLEITSPVKMQVLPTVGGTSMPASISIGPAGNFGSDINLSISPPGGWKSVEYSWNGSAFSPVPTFTVRKSGNGYPNTSLAVRVTGNDGGNVVGVTATGGGKTRQSSFTLDINKNDTNYEER